MANEALTHDQENDYTLKEGEQSVWITVGDLSVYICRDPTGGPGLSVEVYPHGKEMEDALGYCSVERSDG